MFLILLGQLVCAAQYIVEEFLLRPPHVAPPMALVGLEGLWGSLFMGLVLYLCQFYFSGTDGRDHNVYESTTDSLDIESSNQTVQNLTLVFFFSVLCYNIIGVTVTAESSAIHHTFLDASRTATVWACAVGLRMWLGEGYGEELTRWSAMQGLGFVLLVVGQLVYDEAIVVFSGGSTGNHFLTTEGLDLEEISLEQRVCSVPQSAADRWLTNPLSARRGTPAASPLDASLASLTWRSHHRSKGI